MPPDPNEPVTLTSATTEFKAAAIARALEARGIPSRIYGALTTGFRAEAPGVSNVMVLRKDLDRAKAALAEIKAESDEIDWSEAERYAPPDAQLTDAPPPAPIPFPASGRTIPPSDRRWAWTLIIVVLLPAGGFLTVLAAQMAADPVMRAVGPIILGVAFVMALWLISSKPEDAEADEHTHGS